MFSKAVYAVDQKTDENNKAHLINGAVEFSFVNSRKYTLGPNDVISVLCFGNPDYDQKSIRVQPDGNIILAPLGVIRVSGLTLENLNDLLIEKYKTYLKNPMITINLEHTKPFIVYVTGAVINPGSYELDTNVEKSNSISNSSVDRKTPLLTSMITASGGLLADADLEHIKISNGFDGSTFDVNLLNLLEAGNFNQDIYLTPGDMIYVPKLPTPMAVSPEKYRKYASATFSPKTIPVKVYGYVNKPGLFFLDSSQSLNLSSAIFSAGGYLTDSAYSPKKVFLSRADSSGKLITMIVNPTSRDVTLMPNDIIYVPEKSRPLVGKACDYLTRVFTPLNTFASAYNNWALMFNPTRYNVIGK